MARVSATLFTTAVLRLSLMLLVQQGLAKKETLGGAYDSLSKTCKATLNMMATATSQIGACTQLAVGSVIDSMCE